MDKLAIFIFYATVMCNMVAEVITIQLNSFQGNVAAVRVVGEWVIVVLKINSVHYWPNIIEIG